MAYRANDRFGIDDQPFQAGSDGGRTLANVNYALTIAGFFTGGVTTLIAVILAYLNRPTASLVVRSHFNWQIRIFWHCVLAGLAIFVLHGVVIGLGALTFGVGLIFLVIPWAVAAWWVVWTIWATIKGLQRLGRNEIIR